MSDKLSNRRRCLVCPNYDTNVCPLMAKADVFLIDNCILEHDGVKSLKEGSAEWFMFQTNPILFMSYLNYTRKAILPSVGSKVVTLCSGFGGRSGATRYVESIDSEYIYLVVDLNKVPSESRYCCSIEDWYLSIFEI